MTWGAIVKERRKQYKQYDVSEGQRDILASTARFNAVIAGTGAGKTACGALWLCREIAKKPQGKFLIVTPSFKVLNSATYPTWAEVVDGTDFQGSYHPTYGTYDLPTGGIIYFRSAESPESLQGIVADAAWVDEGGLMSRKVWTTIQQRLGYRQGRCLVTTTPYAFNWLLDFHKRALQGDTDYYVRQFPSTENPTYSQDEFNRARDTLPAHDFAMLYEGKFCRAAGLVYPEMSACVADVASIPQGRVVGGLDWGFTDPFVALGGVLDSDDCLWLIYERYLRQKTLDVHAKYLPKEPQWWADSAQPEYVKNLRRLGFRIKPAFKGAGSIAHGINLVHQRMRRGKLKIARINGKPCCPMLLLEAENYCYDVDAEGEYKGETNTAGDDHACDALRYLIMSLDRVRKMQALDAD